MVVTPRRHANGISNESGVVESFQFPLLGHKTCPVFNTSWSHHWWLSYSMLQSLGSHPSSVSDPASAQCAARRRRGMAPGSYYAWGLGIGETQIGFLPPSFCLTQAWLLSAFGEWTSGGNCLFHFVLKINKYFVSKKKKGREWGDITGQLRWSLGKGSMHCSTKESAWAEVPWWEMENYSIQKELFCISDY